MSMQLPTGVCGGIEGAIFNPVETLRSWSLRILMASMSACRLQPATKQVTGPSMISILHTESVLCPDLHASVQSAPRLLEPSRQPRMNWQAIQQREKHWKHNHRTEKLARSQLDRSQLTRSELGRSLRLVFHILSRHHRGKMPHLRA
jgi:hypothetical protein